MKNIQLQNMNCNNNQMYFSHYFLLNVTTPLICKTTSSISREMGKRMIEVNQVNRPAFQGLDKITFNHCSWFVSPHMLTDGWCIKALMFADGSSVCLFICRKKTWEDFSCNCSVPNFGGLSTHANFIRRTFLSNLQHIFQSNRHDQNG